MERSVLVALILGFSSVAFAQESGMPTQSGTQEPEVPGNPPPAPGRPPSDPDSVHIPKPAESQKQDRAQKTEKDACTPGQDARKCVELQRGRK